MVATKWKMLAGKVYVKQMIFGPQLAGTEVVSSLFFSQHQAFVSR